MNAKLTSISTAKGVYDVKRQQTQNQRHTHAERET